MARLFDDASNQYLSGSPPVVNVPCSISAWFNSDNDTDIQGNLSIFETSGAEYNMLAIASSPGVRAYSRNAAEFRYGGTSTMWTANTWNHACAVFASSSSRTAYLNGGGKGTNTVNVGTNDADIAYIGVRQSGIYKMSGAVAEVAIWNVALTDAEVAVLAAGYSPLFVRPQNLVAYWPLIRDEDQDRVGGYNMTPVNSPTIAAHPRVLYPAPLIFMPPITVGAPPIGDAVPVCWSQYRARRI